jgi:hypothetical protein
MSNEKYYLITDNFNCYTLEEGVSTTCFHPEFDCHGKELYIQNDINMKTKVLPDEMWQDYKPLIQVVTLLNLVSFNADKSGIRNPVFREITKYLSYLKFERFKEFNVPEDLVDKTNSCFKNIHNSQSGIERYLWNNPKIKDKIVDLSTVWLNHYEDAIKIIIKDRKDFINSSIHQTIVDLFSNYHSLANISLFSSAEAKMDENDKTNYPDYLVNNQEIRHFLSDKAFFVHNNLLTRFFDKKRRVHQNIFNKYSVENTLYNHSWSYYTYNLNTFSIVYDFILRFNNKSNLSNILHKDLQQFFAEQKIITAPSIIIIEALCNWNLYLMYLSKTGNKLSLKGFEHNGIAANDREYKNTIFDLSEIILSCLAIPFDHAKSVFVTKDGGCLLPFKMYNFKVLFNNFSMSPTNMLNFTEELVLKARDQSNQNKNPKPYYSVLDNFEFSFCENKILRLINFTHNNVYEDEIIELIKSNKSQPSKLIDEVLNYFLCLGNNDEVQKQVISHIRDDDYFKNKEKILLSSLLSLTENLSPDFNKYYFRIINNILDPINGVAMDKLAHIVKDKKNQINNILPINSQIL